MMHDLYWWPKFPGVDLGIFRLGGPGLGNLLFPWARAIHRASQDGGEVLFPVWPQIKLGPLLRREHDKRFYGNILAPTLRDQAGLRRLSTMIKLPKVREIDPIRHRSVVVVSGLADQFRSIYKNQSLIVEEMMERAIGQARVEWNSEKKRQTIAVHIRLGDFSRPQSENEANRISNTSTPLSWYYDIICAIQAKRPDTKFELHSDGDEEALLSILKLRNVYRPFVQSALHGMVSIAKCEALIGSGSTFSRWGCFFGRVPSVYFPGQLREPVFNGEILETECFASDFSKSILHPLVKT